MRIQNSLRNISTGIIGQILTLIFSFITRTVFIYTLGITYLGLSSLLSNVLMIFSLAELGVGQAIVYSLYKAIADNDEIKMASLMNLYKKIYTRIGIIIMVIGTSFTPFLELFIKGEQEIEYLELIYILFVISTGISYFYSYRISFIIANQKNYIVTQVSYYFLVISNLLQILFLYLTNNYIVYLLIQMISGVIQNIYLSNKCLRLYPFLRTMSEYNLDKGEQKEIFKNINALILYKIGTISLNSTDNLIISSFIGLLTVGLYSNYNLILISVSGFLAAIFSSLTASIGNLVSKENSEKQVFMFNVVNFASFWIYGVSSISLFVLMTPFVHFWIGNEYVLDPHVIFVIVLNFYLGGLLFAPYTYRQTLGLFIYGKYRPIISAVLNLIFSIYFVQYFGLAGVFWGTIITRLLTNIWFDPYIVYKKGFNLPVTKYFLRYIYYMIILILSGMLTYSISGLITMDSTFATLMSRGIICVIIPNIFILILFYKTPEFSYLVQVMKNILYKYLGKGANTNEKI